MNPYVFYAPVKEGDQNAIVRSEWNSILPTAEHVFLYRNITVI
jgi:hypothetical protein